MPRAGMSGHVRRGALLLAVLAAALLAGCSPYKIAGDQLFRFGEKQIFPHELAGQDLGIGCAAAIAFTGPAIGFETVGTNVDQLGEMILLTSGVCVELEALEHELAFLRAMRLQQPVPAQDARIAQKRLHILAAKRERLAYQRFQKMYGDLPEGKCPKFRNDFDELVYIVGLLAGVQAMVNDAQANQFLNISRDIAPKTIYQSRCINGRKWWDLPDAMQAALWQVAPMLAPAELKESPMATLHRVAARGKRDGVRLGHVVWAMAAVNSGDYAAARAALRDFTAIDASWQPDAQYRILDVIAGEIMQAVSDRLWTEAVGHRTPMGALGTFWDDVPAQADIEDLL